MFRRSMTIYHGLAKFVLRVHAQKLLFRALHPNSDTIVGLGHPHFLCGTDILAMGVRLVRSVDHECDGRTDRQRDRQNDLL